jgi:hypothetical protein
MGSVSRCCEVGSKFFQLTANQTSVSQEICLSAIPLE